MRKIFYLCVILLTCSGVWGQKNVRGSGYILTQQRETSYFTGINVAQNISVYVVPGELQPITIEADDNLFPYIKTVVKDRILKIYIPDTVNITKFAVMSVLISMPVLRDLQARQSSLIDASPQDWDSPTINVYASSGSHVKLASHAGQINLSGKTSANIELKGEANELNANLTTGARLYAREFTATTAKLNIATTARADIRVNKKISYELNGNAKLTYRGNPQVGTSFICRGCKVIHDK